MRLAIAVASSYTHSQKLRELLHAESDAELLRQRLSERDAGFTAVYLPAVRGFSDELERNLKDFSPVDELFLFFSGYAIVSEEGFPAIVLDGERLSTMSLQRLRRLVTQGARSTFIVLDVVSAFEPPQGTPDMLRLFDRVIAGKDAGVHVLAAHRVAPGDVEAGTPSPFASLLALTLDWQANGAGLSAGELFWEMQREDALFSRIASVALFEAQAPFPVLIPEGEQVVSLPPLQAAPPSDTELEARADALLAEGDVEGALVEYTHVLAALGPPAPPRHTALYVKIAAALVRAERLPDALAYYEAALDFDGVLVAALQGAAEVHVALGEWKRALSFFERWVAADPNALAALEQSARVLAEAESWEELGALYGSALPRVTEGRVAVELALKVDALCQKLLKRPRDALPALERAAELAPDAARVRRRLGELYEQPEPARALPHHLSALRIDRRPGDYRVALRLFERLGRADGCWNAACALEVLGEADVNESLLAAQHRPDTLLPVRAAITEEAWTERLFAKERDPVVDALIAALGDGLVEVGLEAAQQKRRVAALEPSTLMDPDKTTTTLIKVAARAAKLLSVPVPKIYLAEALATPFLAPPTREPSLLVSRTLGSGLGMPALAFLWSRQLAFLRPEHRAIVFFPSVAELAAMFLAGLSFGGLPQMPLKKLEGDEKRFARGLRRHFAKGPPSALEDAARSFPLRDATARIFEWAKAVELSAGRAGLLACGDAELAVTLTRRFPLGGLVEADKQVDDLLAYSVSDEHAALRERIGVLVRA